MNTEDSSTNSDEG